MQGVARFSQTLNDRDEQLRNLLANANKATTVLAERSDQVVGLIARHQRAAGAAADSKRRAGPDLGQSSRRWRSSCRGFIADNREQLRPALDKLNGVLTIVDNRKERVQKSIKLLNAYAMSLGESVSSGPFFKAYLANLLPGQFCSRSSTPRSPISAWTPMCCCPRERTDPQIGQPGTPALPVPYPRTGQGGEPHLTLPDAITGNPGDPRYPLPASRCRPRCTGGPPPGPPAPAARQSASTPEPTPAPVRAGTEMRCRSGECSRDLGEAGQ